MPEVGGGDCVEAWRNAVKLVRSSGGEAFNLVITVGEPTKLVPDWLLDYNPRGIIPTADRIQDVVNTVFPYRLAARCNSRDALYAEYLRSYDRGKRFSRNRG